MHNKSCLRFWIDAKMNSHEHLTKSLKQQMGLHSTGTLGDLLIIYFKWSPGDYWY